MNALDTLAQANLWPAYSKRLRAEIAAVPELAQQFYVGLFVFIYEGGNPEATEVDVTVSTGSQCHFGAMAALNNERIKLSTLLMEIGPLVELEEILPGISGVPGFLPFHEEYLSLWLDTGRPRDLCLPTEESRSKLMWSVFPEPYDTENYVRYMCPDVSVKDFMMTRRRLQARKSEVARGHTIGTMVGPRRPLFPP